jgi:hypothetical protein
MEADLLPLESLTVAVESAAMRECSELILRVWGYLELVAGKLCQEVVRRVALHYKDLMYQQDKPFRQGWGGNKHLRGGGWVSGTFQGQIGKQLEVVRRWLA